jgi:hypothetical protein
MRSPVMIGPFLSASMAIEQMASNLYFTHLLSEAVEQQRKCEFELKLAKATGDEELIKQCEMDLAIVERAYQITAMLELDESVE